VQAECEVNWLLPRQDPQDPTRVIYDVLSPSLSQCPDGATSNNIADDCWYLTKDLGKCPVNGQVVQVLRTAEHIKDKTLLDPGTRVRMNCHVCPASSTEPGCDYNLGN